MDRTSKQHFSPLCDLHHTSMQRMAFEEDSEEARSHYACCRRDCTRVFRDSDGYSDFVQNKFDDTRASLQMCPRCEAILYLAEVDHTQKIEIWECPQTGCDFSAEFPSPSAR